jgi:hypothetical protein
MTRPNRLTKLERAARIHAGAAWDPAQAAGLWSPQEALDLLACITDSELEALAGGDATPLGPGAELRAVKTASDAELAAMIFGAAPDLLAVCRQRLANRHDATTRGRGNSR